MRAMSHFLLWVVSEGLTADNADAVVTEALERFDEGKEVPEYDRKCYCVGDLARKDADVVELRMLGKIDEAREAYWARPEAERTDAKWRELARLDEREALRARVLAGHHWADKPDPRCGYYSAGYPDWTPEQVGTRYDDGSGCGGTGTYRSTYNPDSKWDWWKMGGRWAGYLSGLGDVTTVDAVLADGRDWEKDCPFAVLYRNEAGEWTWAEKGQMGWFGVCIDEKTGWPVTCRALVETLRGRGLAVVDCHT